MEMQENFLIENITIEDIVNDIFTNYSIKKKRKDIVAFYTSKLQLDLFQSESVIEGITKTIDKILREDKNSSDPYLRYSNSYYYKTRKKSKSINPVIIADSNYVGKGGECAVMSELLFRGYNVNNMIVDEGIDLVASKNNVFFYIQVKTKNVVEQNRFYFQIKQDRFDTFIGTQIRYILVARCTFNKEERNIFFTFTNDDILRFKYNRVIPEPTGESNSLSLKIEYDVRTGKAYLYDGKEREDVSFNMNKFNL